MNEPSEKPKAIKTAEEGSAAPGRYALGRSREEYGRLVRQAQLMEPITRRFFLEAGITPRMHVLDLGSGVGDVSFLVSKLVGPHGSVVGVDLDAQAIEEARARASAGALTNVSFVNSDLSTYLPDKPVDALVGRFVLMYQSSPGSVLKRLSEHVRVGGSVAFMEPWYQTMSGPGGVLQAAVNCIVETLRRSGAKVDLGARLHRVFAEAELPGPFMRFEAVIDPRSDSPAYAYVADTVRSLLPKARQLQIPVAASLEVDSIAGAIRDEMAASGYAMILAPVVTAWARKL
jgi:ubiquinone/menaquinone biosynthesis C-methylase UbiE